MSYARMRSEAAHALFMWLREHPEHTRFTAGAIRGPLAEAGFNVEHLSEALKTLQRHGLIHLALRSRREWETVSQRQH
jgi:hypothetical protein